MKAPAQVSTLVFPWQSVLVEIREWLDAHPREVVILSFSHFLGLSQELHTLLITTIRNIFCSKLCPTTVTILQESYGSWKYYWFIFFGTAGGVCSEHSI